MFPTVNGSQMASLIQTYALFPSQLNTWVLENSSSKFYFLIDYKLYLLSNRFISYLELHNRLGPLVFDEIHKIITDIDYRDAFRNFHALNSVNAVIFGFTGSLPPSLYPVLCELTAMTWKIIRTPSSRKELKYQVVRIRDEKDIDSSIVEHLHSKILSYRPEDRAMVFCRSKEHVTNLASLFKIHPYYSPGENDILLERNKEAMVRWISGENKVMASTSILGCGFDYAHVRDVVHREPSFTMLDQYQEDSRGGRDGLECRATTFVVDQKKYKVPPNQSYNLGTQVLFDTVNETETCLRIGPSTYLDGQPTQCVSFPGAQFCENCEKMVGKSSAGDCIPSLPLLRRQFSPPKRSFDFFDVSPVVDLSPPSRRVDLQEHLRLLKRKRGSLDSTSSTVSRTSNSSASKRVRFSDITVPSR